MFKIHENGDGTTSIFCNQTGKLICTIKSQQKSMGLGYRPANVVEASAKPRSCCYNLDLKGECVSDIECISDVEEQNTREIICDAPPLDEPKDDFFDDCVTQDQFARCLNLIPKEKCKNESIENLKSSFPLRLISRTKEPLVPDDLRDMKYYDHVPLCSCLGIKLLNFNKQKNFYSNQTSEMKTKSYDSFCRFQLNTVSESSNFPKLRCREKKDYPICITQRLLQYAHTHMYAFNRRQRLEKLITFRTGLNTCSRRLLLKCNKRLAVSIKRLSPEDIDKWQHKRSKIGRPITADDIKGEEPSSMASSSITTVIDPGSPVYIDLFSSDSEEPSDSDDPDVEYTLKCGVNKYEKSNDINNPSVKYPLKLVLNNSKTGFSPLKSQTEDFAELLNKYKIYEDCCVNVKNVLNIIHKCVDKYYVAGTNICIPFFKDFLNSLDKKVLSGVIIPETSDLKDSCNDHAYHRPFSREGLKSKLLNSKCLIHKTPARKIKGLLTERNCIKSKSNSKTKFNCVKNSNSYKSSVNKTVSRIEDVPLIDLTNDSSPTAQRGDSSSWQFHCYGCGFKMPSMEEPAAYSMATRHLKDFHCVLDTKAFLNVNDTQSGIILEAFPGYKGSK